MSGRAKWSYTHGRPAGYGTTVIEPHRFSAGGLAFYKGGERLKPVALLNELGDRDLALAYEQQVETTSGAHTAYPIWRDTAVLMAGTGLALTGVALGDVLSKSEEERARDPIPSTLWIGAGVAVLAIVPTVLASTTYDDAVAHDRASELFGERNLLARLEQSVNDYNARVAHKCGLPRKQPPATPAADR